MTPDKTSDSSVDYKLYKQRMYHGFTSLFGAVVIVERLKLVHRSSISGVRQ